MEVVIVEIVDGSVMLGGLRLNVVEVKKQQSGKCLRLSGALSRRRRCRDSCLVKLCANGLSSGELCILCI